MSQIIEEEIRANTPIAQGNIPVAEGLTATLSVEGEWICNSLPTGAGGNPGEQADDSGKYPYPGANRGSLVITVTRGTVEEKHAFATDADTFVFAGPCTLGFSPNDDVETLDENFGLLTLRVEIA